MVDINAALYSQIPDKHNYSFAGAAKKINIGVNSGVKIRETKKNPQNPIRLFRPKNATRKHSDT